MKKLFHRKKHNELDSSPTQSSPYSAKSDPGLRTSLYDTTAAGGSPQTGDYPIKGNDTANVLKKKPSRRSSIRSWRSSSSNQQGANFNRSPTPDRYAGRGVPSQPVDSNTMGSETYAPQPTRQKRWSRTQLPQDFSHMNLGNEANTMTTTTTTTTTGPQTTIHTLHGGPSGSVAPQGQLQSQVRRQGYETASIRPVNPSDVQGAYTSNPAQTRSRRQDSTTSSNLQGNHASQKSPVNNAESQSQYSANGYGKQSQRLGFAGADGNSIPRKEVGAGSAPKATEQFAPSYVGKGINHDMSADKRLSSAPDTSRRGFAPRQTEQATAPPASSPLATNTPISKGQPKLDAQAVADRATTSTKDTSIVEKYAPAVVHETVHEDVHHVREELIRREIHTHDVYHRMLPVIDVEVLPARHFLPVEGGGLVEISAEEVPGRGNNWVLAETVSKIPSDQAATPGTTNFTARKFPGREGDEIRYVTPEGHEKAEQTWVHPPELETGARDTGQSWPMVFGGNAPEKGTYGYKSTQSSKGRSSKHTSMGSDAVR